ncbi:MAG: dTDP-4-dehydrorhamnose reductase [Acidimicrobiia bacterium]|nr:dTDP-4-dehydrorhamnose reductase [Acidimicrobiia bacterium]
MKLLVTGGRGQVGAELVAFCAARGDEVVAPERARMDVASRDAVLALVGDLRPDVIVNLAARTDVDGCETHPDGAWLTNVLGVRHVAEAARRFDAHLVHLSSDYVFDGSKKGAYVEWDEVTPLSVYGRSKAAAEREALWGCPGAAVLRTSWVCGAAGASNVPKTIVRLLRDDPTRELAFVDDQIGQPTLVESLVPAIRQLAVHRRPGIVHITNEGPVSWHEFAQAVVVAAGGSADQVRSITTAELVPARPAPRPANSVLDNTVLRLAGGPSLGHWSEPLSRLVKELQ